MEIAIEVPDSADVVALLKRHVEEARKITPPGFSFALPENALLAQEIVFWAARDAGELLGFAALKDLGDGTGEVKSMRTGPRHLRKGVASALLDFIIRDASRNGFSALYLETGTTDEYNAARKLYDGHGFFSCDPFADYVTSEHNCYMQLAL